MTSRIVVVADIPRALERPTCPPVAVAAPAASGAVRCSTRPCRIGAGVPSLLVLINCNTYLRNVGSCGFVEKSIFVGIGVISRLVVVSSRPMVGRYSTTVCSLSNSRNLTSTRRGEAGRRGPYHACTRDPRFVTDSAEEGRTLGIIHRLAAAACGAVFRVSCLCLLQLRVASLCGVSVTVCFGDAVLGCWLP